MRFVVGVVRSLFPLDSFGEVFWWPHDLGGQDVFDQKKVVLLGEAICPPLSTLGPRFRAHRLPLYQRNRQSPIGTMAFETFQKSLDQYVEGLRESFGLERLAELEAKNMAKEKRQEDLYALECDLMNAFPESFAKLMAERPPPPPPKPPGQKMRPRPPGQGQRPVAIPTGAAGEFQDLPGAYRGPCCLDIDLAFIGPADPKHGLQAGHDGTLAFELRTLRAPPLDHGYVRVRVCEAALEDPVASYNGSGSSDSTQNGQVLEQNLLENLAMGAPSISQTRALWSSPMVVLGSWAGSGCAPPCTAAWTARKASASLWIATREEVLRASKHDMLPRTAQEEMTFRRCKHFSIPVTNEWSPITLVPADPLPRSRELFDEMVMSNAAGTLLSKIH